MAQRIIFHIDVNSAYLSWESIWRIQHGDPLDLRTIPSAIGGNPETRHGIILAKSIPAKEFGIQTGETLYSALAKCPNLVIAKPNYRLYKQCSSAMLSILKNYSPFIQQFSVDEFWVSYTNMEKLYGNPVQAAYIIKDRIKNELGFTVNIGISTNKLLAKVAGELKKPDMVHTLYPEEVPEKMWGLPVEDLFLVGPATAKKLRERNIKTIGELAHTDVKLLRKFLKSHGEVIWNYAHGIDNSPIRPGGTIIAKGYGNSTTIPFDIEDARTAHLVLLSLVETVSVRLRQDNVRGMLVAISFRSTEFLNYSHQRKIADPTDSTNEIWEIACDLFDELWQGQPLRHLGIRVSELCSNDFTQLSLFGRDTEKERKVDRTVDAIRERFGVGAIVRSTYLHSGLNPITGGVPEEDYPQMSSIL